MPTEKRSRISGTEVFGRQGGNLQMLVLLALFCLIFLMKKFVKTFLSTELGNVLNNYISDSLKKSNKTNRPHFLPPHLYTTHYI